MKNTTRNLTALFVLFLGLSFSTSAFAQGPHKHRNHKAKKTVTVKKTTKTRKGRTQTVTVVKRTPVRTRARAHGNYKVKHRPVVVRTRHHNVRHNRHFAHKTFTRTHYEWIRGRRFKVTTKTVWRHGQKRVYVTKTRAPRKVRRIQYTGPRTRTYTVTSRPTVVRYR